MKHKQFLVSLALLSFIGMGSAFAQYYGGYGGGYGGYGGYGYGRGYGRGYNNSFNNPGFNDGKPKPPPDPDEVAKEETRLMVKKLKLTGEQEAVIASLNEDYAYQRHQVFDTWKKLIGDTKPTQEQIDAAKGQLAEIDKRKDKELQGILTEEQFKIYQEIKEKNKKASRN